MTHRILVAALALMVTLTVAWPALAAEHDITVKAERRGDLVVLDVRVLAPFAVADVWAVLTDYEHMTQFLPALKASSAVRHSNTQLEVTQTGEARFGPFTFTATSVRAVDLQPMREIRGRLLSGDFKTYTFLTRLAEHSTETLILYHGEYVPKAWVPSFVGVSMIEDQTRLQYEQLLAEMQRRRTPGSGVHPPPANQRANTSSAPQP